MSTARVIVIAMAIGGLGCDESAPPMPAEKPPAPTVATPTAVPTCKGECLPVPEGIAGTLFGMKYDALKTAFGKLRRRTVAKRRVNAGPRCSETVKTPGSLYSVKTELGGEKARCQFHVLPEKGLVDISCDLGARRKPREHDEIAWVLYQSLARQYGPGTLQNRINDGYLLGRWESEEAVLILRASRRQKRSSIALINQSTLLNEALDAQDASIAAECAAREAELAAKKGEREKRLREKAKQFERDLRPPLEKPKDN